MLNYNNGILFLGKAQYYKDHMALLIQAKHAQYIIISHCYKLDLKGVFGMYWGWGYFWDITDTIDKTLLYFYFIVWLDFSSFVILLKYPCGHSGNTVTVITNTQYLTLYSQVI